MLSHKSICVDEFTSIISAGGKSRFSGDRETSKVRTPFSFFPFEIFVVAREILDRTSSITSNLSANLCNFNPATRKQLHAFWDRVAFVFMLRLKFSCFSELDEAHMINF